MRITQNHLSEFCNERNKELAGIGSKWRYVVGSRCEYQVVDLATVEQLKKHCIQCTLATGTSRECVEKVHCHFFRELANRYKNELEILKGEMKGR